ncbi:MAG: UDP-3-O-(3-hydroxymyristoyl)glucosamine N-acyltransferase [Firmicutes bacterium]|nr:UDP-3-O-(3-hydroxymyristoyl)glucosamine N-acyltransferase [Bacillota bacterium]MDD4693150.1 UDP-3-O-(3-hydroxymyristoyl)glucosamine N-acyltransferase [Bacillota bacterium]
MKISAKKEPITLGQLHTLIGGELLGDPNTMISYVAPITEAKDGAITLVAGNSAKDKAKENLASAYIIEKKFASDLDVNGIIIEDGRRAFGVVLGYFKRDIIHTGAISSNAVVALDAKIGSNVTVYDYSYIANDAVIGDNTVIYPNVFIGPGSKIGKGSVVYPQVVIRENVTIGDRAIIHSGVIIGVDGFGFTFTEEGWKKVPQIGGVVIGDDVELYSNTSIASGAAGPTIIQNGVKIGDMTHIGHNSVIGKDSIMAGQIGISGSTIIGERVMVGGQVMFAGHQTIGDGAGIMSQALVEGDLEPKVIVSGNPARDNKRELRIKASLQGLPELRKEVKELAKKLDEILDNSKGN